MVFCHWSFDRGLDGHFFFQRLISLIKKSIMYPFQPTRTHSIQHGMTAEGAVLLLAQVFFCFFFLILFSVFSFIDCYMSNKNLELTLHYTFPYNLNLFKWDFFFLVDVKAVGRKQPVTHRADHCNRSRHVPQQSPKWLLCCEQTYPSSS